MFRKALLTIAAAATMVLGVAATTAPAEAGHRRPHISFYFGDGYPGGGYYRRGYVRNYGYGHRHGHCHVRKVWRYGERVRIKNCHRHGHSGGHHR